MQKLRTTAVNQVIKDLPNGLLWAMDSVPAPAPGVSLTPVPQKWLLSMKPLPTLVLISVSLTVTKPFVEVRNGNLTF